MPLTRLVAGGLGAVYLVLGIAGFFVTGFAGHGTLLVFPTSPLDNTVNMLVGAAGIGACLAGPALSRTYCQVGGGLLAVVAVVGIVIGDPFGLVPIGGFDVVLHTASALVPLYVGFATGEELATT